VSYDVAKGSISPISVTLIVKLQYPQLTSVLGVEVIE
jgi:hypothetical protein